MPVWKNGIKKIEAECRNKSVEGVDTVINTYPHPHTNLTSEENSEHLYLERV
jgi:hypothetical protein